MRVLQICLKPPLPQIDGGCKAMNNITQGLLVNKIGVKVLTLSTPKHPYKKEIFSEQYLSQTKIENVFVDTAVSIIAAFFNLFSSNSYNIERFYSIEFDRLIVKTIKDNTFDIVLLESLYVSKYLPSIRKNTSAKIIYRAHNIESEIWERNASYEKSLKKIYLKFLCKRLKNYEQKIIDKFDGIAAITEKDKNHLVNMGCNIPIRVFPFGIDINNYKLTPAKEENSIFHIGSMDWKPNQNGINWFLSNVWEKVIEKFPDAILNLAGKDMPDSLLNHKQKNVNIVGEVEDANDFISQNEIMVVPLFAASGMRIKIIEGMALQKLIIATTIAAEGIQYIDGENIIIANSEIEFAGTILKYLSDKKELNRIAKNGRQLIESNYDNQLIVNNLVEFFKQIID